MYCLIELFFYVDPIREPCIGVVEAVNKVRHAVVGDGGIKLLRTPCGINLRTSWAIDPTSLRLLNIAGNLPSLIDALSIMKRWSIWSIFSNDRVAYVKE